MQTLPRSQRVAGRIYRISLLCYPRRHRARFGAEMAQLFADLCQEVYRREGTAGLVGLWLASLADLFKSALEMRWKELAQMKREDWARLGGWALILGSITLAVGAVISSFETQYWDPLGGSDGFYEYGGVAGMATGTLLLGIGMLGMRSRYGLAAGPLASLSLLLAGLAGLVSTVGGIAVALIFGDGWYVWMGGFIGLFAGLLVFGVAAWRSGVLGRWRFLPIVPGLLMPLGFGLGVDVPSRVLIPLMAACLIMLGYLVQRSTRTPAVAAA